MLGEANINSSTNINGQWTICSEPVSPCLYKVTILILMN